MKHSAAYLLLIVASLIVINPMAALAVDYYVDGVNGDDANSGLSPDDAFRTITYALEVIQPTEDAPGAISVAAGTYAASTNGEAFPLVLKAHLRLLGQGPETSVLDAECKAHHILICQFVENVKIVGLGILHSYALGDEQAEDGGCAIICDASSLDLDGCVVGENSAMDTEDAGAILCTNSQLTLVSCTIRDNQAGVRFGPGGLVSPSGISCDYSLLTLRSCLVVGNAGVSPWGSNGVLDILRSQFALDSSRVSGNGDGRTIAISLSSAAISACEISDNAGGAVWAFKSPLVMRNCTLEGNSKGGTVCCQEASEAWIIDCVIRGNTAGSDRLSSACVDCSHSTMHLARCVVAGNSAHNAAIGYAYAIERGYVRMTIEDSLICHNLSAYGGPIMRYGYGSGPLPDMRNNGLYSGAGADYVLSVKRCTIVGNRASDNHADNLCVFPYVSLGLLEDNIVADNDGSLSYEREKSQNQVRYCCLQEAFDGEGNFAADPLFVSGPLGHYYLSAMVAGQDADSPCIDAGSTSASIAGMGELTTRTDSAFDTGIVDIGYHYSATPPTIEASIGASGTTGTGAGEAPVLLSGDILSAQVTVENDGWTFWADVYAAFIAPDGAVFYLTPSGLTSDFTPYAIDVRLDDGLHFGPFTIFEFTLNEHVPAGNYTFAAALSRAREPFAPIGDIAFSQFTVGG
ncbi:MAG: right-handed parallel beta-helix repeat-containing protein [Candidatus Coatesbacteria bacterium]|nr:right-handed parallel beta-helix repeat-containing protein [Candidatus Coatesbacteria bacterium]